MTDGIRTIKQFIRHSKLSMIYNDKTWIKLAMTRIVINKDKNNFFNYIETKQ